jgi:hypothetical protein
LFELFHQDVKQFVYVGIFHQIDGKFEFVQLRQVHHHRNGMKVFVMIERMTLVLVDQVGMQGS